MNRGAWLAFGLFVVAGCGLMPPAPQQVYEGAPLTLDKVAVITAGCHPFINVKSLDGKGIDLTKPVQGIHVLPGTHEVGLRYSADMHLGPVTTGYKYAETVLSQELAAGHTYFLNWTRLEDKVAFRLEDKGEGYNQECVLPQVHCDLYMKGQVRPGC